MSFFLAVLFVCAADGCVFLQSNEKYFSEKECMDVVTSTVDELKKEVPLVNGGCIHVDTRDLV
jgi:hypothetical protein